MIKHLYTTLIIASLFTLNCQIITAQLSTSEKAKTGWNMGFLPAVTYDSDLGFQYGGLINIFNYGDGSRYPAYNHSLYLEVSRYTKGSNTYRFFYDSDQLLPKIRLTADVSYLTNQLSTFYGFNGYKSVYDKTYITEESANYESRYFYNYDEKLFRIKLDLFGKIADSNFEWSLGATYYNYNINEANLAKLNKGKSADEQVEAYESLREKYLRWGFIDLTEANGGIATYIKTGLSYDTRNQKAFPEKGIWSEAILRTAPGLLSEGQTHAKLTLYYRQYITLVKNRTILAYRLAYQQTVMGKNVPYYLQPLMGASFLTGSSSNGLGGNKSLRGILRKRVVGNGFALSNTELRQIFYRFSVYKQNFYVATNIFFDCGLITDPIEWSLENVSALEQEKYFSDQKESLHCSAGLGLKIAMNQNFIVSFDFGKALDERDGESGLYMGLNYLF